MLVENDIEQIDQLLNQLHQVFHHHLINKKDYGIEINQLYIPDSR
jgi:hypothetical protein